MQTIIPIVFGALCVPALVAARPCTVDTSGGGTHTSLGAALDPSAGCGFVDIVDAVLHERVIAQTDVTIHGAPTTIDGAGVAGGRVFDVASGAAVSLRGLALTGGDDGGLAVRAGGSAVFVEGRIQGNTAVDGAGALVDGSLELRDARVRENTASNDGGGVFVTENGALTLRVETRVRRNAAGRNGGGLLLRNTATFEYADITNNTAALHGGGLALRGDAGIDAVRLVVDRNTAAVHGGGIHARGAVGVASISMQECAMRGNTAQAGNGGAIDSNDATLWLVGGEYSDNSAPNGTGGALRIRGPSGRTLLSVHDVVIARNVARIGGGFYVDPEGSNRVSVYDSVIEDNVATAAGGIGVRLTELTLTDSIVRGNRATLGDAGGVGGSDAGRISLIRSTIADNSAAGDGGALFGEGVEFEVDRSTIHENAAGGDGGGLYSLDGRLHVVNSTIGLNTAGQIGGGIWIEGASWVDVRFATIINNDASVDAKQFHAFDTLAILNAVAIGTENVWPTGASECTLQFVWSDDTHSDDFTCVDLEVDGDQVGPFIGPGSFGLPTFANGAFTPESDSRLKGAVTVTPCPAEDQFGAPRPATGCTVGAVE